MQMQPIFPSYDFLLIMTVITVFLIILSQKIKKGERFILSFIWVAYMVMILAMTIPSDSCNSMTLAEKLNEAPPWNLKPFSLL